MFRQPDDARGSQEVTRSSAKSSYEQAAAAFRWNSASGARFHFIAVRCVLLLFIAWCGYVYSLLRASCVCAVCYWLWFVG
jgi:hypothetical protein